MSLSKLNFYSFRSLLNELPISKLLHFRLVCTEWANVIEDVLHHRRSLALIRGEDALREFKTLDKISSYGEPLRISVNTNLATFRLLTHQSALFCLLPNIERLLFLDYNGRYWKRNVNSERFQKLPLNWRQNLKCLISNLSSEEGIAIVLETLPNLVHLRVTGSFGFEAEKQFGSSLKRLESLQVSSFRVSIEDLPTIGPNLKKLVVGSFYVNDGVRNPLGFVKKENKSRLEHLIIMSSINNASATFLKDLPFLRSIHMAQVPFTEGFSRLLPFLENCNRNPNLKTLGLSLLYDIRVHYQFELKQPCKYIETLYIYWIILPLPAAKVASLFGRIFPNLKQIVSNNYFTEFIDLISEIAALLKVNLRTAKLS